MSKEVETTTNFVTKSDGIEARVTMPAETYRKLVACLESAKVVMEGTAEAMPEEVSELMECMRIGLHQDLDPGVDPTHVNLGEDGLPVAIQFVDPL